MPALDTTTTATKRDAALDVDRVEDAGVTPTAYSVQTGPSKIHGIAMPDVLARLSEEERDSLERHLRRKIDFRLLPMVILMYILNYIDRFVL